MIELEFVKVVAGSNRVSLAVAEDFASDRAYHESVNVFVAELNVVMVVVGANSFTAQQ